MTISKLRTATALLATTLLAALAPGSAAAAPAVDGEFPVSDTPRHLTLGPDGNMWVAVGGKIAKVTPAGEVTEYDPADVDFPFGITTGPDGNLWVTQSGGVAKVPPGDPLTATKFAIAEITNPRAIVTGPDGNLWTASGDQVVKIPPADPTTRTAYTVAGLGARDIASGGDGQLWVADFAGKRVVSVTTAGASAPYPVDGGAQGVAAGPGTQIAYANPGADPHHVGRISPGGQAQKTDVGATDPFGITLGPDGAYWFAQFNGSKVGRMTVDGEVTTLDGLSAGSGPRYIAAGPGNTLWVSLEQANKVARITGVVAPPQPTSDGSGGDALAPAITGFAVAPRAVRPGGRVKLRYTLSEAARVRIAIERLRRGTPRGARAVRTITSSGVQGRNRVRFRARAGRRALAPGRYRVTATATDATGNVSRPRRASFRVVGR
jgi:streptogramin lyase